MLLHAVQKTTGAVYLRIEKFNHNLLLLLFEEISKQTAFEYSGEHRQIQILLLIIHR